MLKISRKGDFLVIYFVWTTNVDVKSLYVVAALGQKQVIVQKEDSPP